MGLPKRGGLGNLLVNSAFDGRKNLMHRENATVSTNLDSTINMELDTRKAGKEQQRTFWLPLSLGMCARWFMWAVCLTKLIRNDSFGLEELLQMEDLQTS
jgi:hypothetical protein